MKKEKVKERVKEIERLNERKKDKNEHCQLLTKERIKE